MSHFLLSIFLILLSLQPLGPFKSMDERAQIAAEMEKSINTELLNKWYPQGVDKEYGGFLSTFTYDFKPTGAQDKMIVTQARHTWSNSKASLLYPENKHYKTSAAHGFKFLKNVMWDKTYGGFHQLVTRQGNVKEIPIKQHMEMLLVFMHWLRITKHLKMQLH